MINAYAASGVGQDLEPISYDPGPLADDEVHVRVESCGICHSDLSMLNNEWGTTKYPLVPGHEVVGVVSEKGARVTNLEVGQRVGIGWQSGSCATCEPCISGSQQMCASGEKTVVGRHGGFADAVRVKSTFAFALPDGMDAASAGPLLCGGITVFEPLYSLNIKPTQKIGVVGIGGLGHLAIKFARAWGCEVTAFTSTDSKADEARNMGAHRVVNSTDAKALAELQGQLDLIIVTVNVALDWSRYVAALGNRGRLHFVGLVLSEMNVPPAALISKQKQISGSPIGSPSTIGKMLEFAARHDIRPTVETFKFDQVNEAIAHLAKGDARYRVVLQHKVD